LKLAPFVILLLAFGLFGCLGIGDTSGSGGGTSFGESSGRAAPSMAPSPVSGVAANDGQYITKSGYISIKVPEGTLKAKFEDMQAKLKSGGAELGDITYNEYSDRKTYSLSVKVVPDRFESMLTTLQGVGEVKDLSVNLEDVTKQYTDLDTRIRNKEIELKRLQDLYDKAGNVSDLLSVERELGRVETELELLKQEKDSLTARIQKSTINITLYVETPATQQFTVSLEGLAGLFFGAMAAAIMLIIGAAGFLIPLIAMLALLWFIYKKTRPKPKLGK